MEWPKEFLQKMRILLKDDYDRFLKSCREERNRGIKGQYFKNITGKVFADESFQARTRSMGSGRILLR